MDLWNSPTTELRTVGDFVRRQFSIIPVRELRDKSIQTEERDGRFCPVGLGKHRAKEES